MQNKILLLLISIFICSIVHAEIEFFKEDLQFELQDGYFIVAGNYYFRNTSNRDIQATLFYPIPRDSMLVNYDSVEVKDSSQDSDSLVTTIRENGFFFKVAIGANSTAQYTIRYRQKLLGDKAKYLFTTTSTWGKPLESAAFQLTFPKNIKIDSLSMLPDSLQEYEDTYTLFWTRENFMPQEDFVVHYHKKKYKKISELPKEKYSIRKDFFYLRLTPYVIPGAAVGYTRRIRLLDGGAIDFTLAVHHHFLCESHKTYGLSLISEHFGNIQAKGLFFRANLGCEYGSYLRLYYEDPENEKKWAPNITGGLGYSIPIFSSSYIRFSAEIGYTMLFGRINCELLL